MSRTVQKRIVVGCFAATAVLVAIGAAGSNTSKSDAASCRLYAAGNTSMEPLSKWYGEIADKAPSGSLQNAWLWLYAHPDDAVAERDPVTRAAWDRIDGACAAAGVAIR